MYRPSGTSSIRNQYVKKTYQIAKESTHHAQDDSIEREEATSAREVIYGLCTECLITAEQQSVNSVYR